MLSSKSLGIAALASFSYFLALSIFDSRLDDGVLYAEEMYKYEYALLMLFLFSFVMLWFRGLAVAFQTNRSLFLSFVFWPYSIYLALSVKSGGKCDNT